MLKEMYVEFHFESPLFLWEISATFATFWKASSDFVAIDAFATGTYADLCLLHRDAHVHGIAARADKEKRE